jgi:phage tail-like protein
MPLSEREMLGVNMRFHVVVDGIDLGGWKSCTGLNVKFGNKQVWSGGTYDHMTLLPEKVTYTEVVLQRAMTAQGSARVQRFLSTVVDEWVNGRGARQYSGRTARITLLDAHNGALASWALRNVYPAEWSGPNLDATGNAIAIETLKFAHEGFLGD